MAEKEARKRIERLLKTVVGDYLEIETGYEPRFLGVQDMPYGVALKFEAPLRRRNDAVNSQAYYDVEIRISVAERVR